MGGDTRLFWIFLTEGRGKFMDMIEKLMKADAGKLKVPEKEYEVKRLTDAFGFPFILKLKAIPAEEYSEIQTNSMEMKKGEISKIKLYNMQLKTILAGVAEPSFKSKELLEHFHAASPKELINQLFLAGEMSNISDEISKLCGYQSQKDVDDEVKN